MIFTKQTLIGDILDNPAAAAALDRAIPGASTSFFFSTVRHLSIDYIDQFAPGKLRKDEVAAVEREFEKLGDV